MDHRRGQRWRIELPIRINHQDVFTPQQALLEELSHHGARVRLFDWTALPGKVIDVWLPDSGFPIRAMVIHNGEWEAGILWIDHEAWLQYLHNHPNASTGNNRSPWPLITEPK